MSKTRVTITLIHGLAIGEDTHKEVVLREPTAGDILDAQEASERLMMVPTPEGGAEPMLISSPSRSSVEVLRRQIVSIGDISGPLDEKLLRKLDPEDLDLLLAVTGNFDAGGSNQVQKEVVRRGRDEGGRPGAE
jgi:phage FluMu protein gp41